MACGRVASNVYAPVPLPLFCTRLSSADLLTPRLSLSVSVSSFLSISFCTSPSLPLPRWESRSGRTVWRRISPSTPSPRASTWRR